MNTLFISIVMPYYNTKPELFVKCLDSVLAQTYDNYELIIVDDGSCVESADFLDSACINKEKVKVWHKNNTGVSDTRNFGTLKAVGDYIMYVDSDDYLAPYALQQGVEVLNKHSIDFIFAGLQRIKNHSDFRVVSVDEVDYISYSKDRIDEVRRSFLTQKNPEYNKIFGYGVVNRGPICRMLKSEIAKNVLFDVNLSLGEDVEWNMRVLNACAEVAFIKSIWYGYVIYENSSLHKYYGDRFQRLTQYQTALYNNNKDYCLRDMHAYIDNLSVSFYTLVDRDYYSKLCLLSQKKKYTEVNGVLSTFPWILLKEKKYQKSLSAKYRIFIQSCSINLEFLLLKVRGLIKDSGNK